MDSDLRGKRAVVTGGTKGIGRATVMRLAELGADVTATYSRDDEAAETLRERLSAFPGTHSVVRCNLGDPEESRHLIEDLERKAGGPDILVCNAAYQQKATVSETDERLMEQTLRVNVTGNFVLLKAAAESMVARRASGSIVVCSSDQAETVNPTGFAYALSKAALNHMVRHCALAYSSQGIRINGIALGWFDTEGERAFYSKEQIERQAAAGIPLRRAGNPAEAAELIAFVASDAAAYVTGSILRIDGGYILAPDTSA